MEEVLRWPLPAYLCRSFQDRIYNFIEGPLHSVSGIGRCLQPNLLSPAAQLFWQELPAAWQCLASHLLPCFRRILQELLPGCPTFSPAHSWVNSSTDQLSLPCTHTLTQTHVFLSSFILAFFLNKTSSSIVGTVVSEQRTNPTTVAGRVSGSWLSWLLFLPEDCSQLESCPT